MIKKIVFTLAGAMAVAGISAAPLTPEQALQRLGGNHHRKVVAEAAQSLRPVYTAKTVSEAPALYVFNNTDGGFFIASADDTAAPLLGYSLTGHFDAANIPPAMQWWLSEYARRIEYANAISAPAYEESEADERPAIEPLLTARWDQVEPFNNLCPMEGAERTYTGCVATSIAQVMYYWKYPEIGQGKTSYMDQNLGKQLTIDFSKRKFDWDLMQDDYSNTYTEEAADAVAYLMRASAFAVKMNFSSAASSAYALNVAPGMKKYFNYDPNMHYEVRSLYSPSEWETMIYENLKNVGPVIYGGSSMAGGGHSFVCDGYDGDGYFHFNWGWSGMSNGYFRLDGLNPRTLGSGGGSGGGYNFSQDAVLGIQPPTGEPEIERLYEIVQGGSLEGEIDGSVLKFKLGAEQYGSWLNYSPVKINATFGAIFEPQEGTEGDTFAAPIDHATVTLSAGYGTSEIFVPTMDLANLDLADGTYKVTFATDIKENGYAGFIPVRPYYNYFNCLMLTKKGDKYSVSAYKPRSLRIVSGGVVGDLVYGCLVTVTATVENDTDVELTRGLAPAFFYSHDGEGDEIYFIGDSQFITVPPHSTVERTWTTNLTATVPIISMNHDADLMLTFFDEASYNYYIDEIYVPVVMKENLGVPNILAYDYKVKGGRSTMEFVNGNIVQVYPVYDKFNIEFSCKVELRGAVPFNYQMLACLIGTEANDAGQLAIYSYSGEPMMINPDDEAVTFSTSLAYPQMRMGEIYYITPAYLYGANFLPIGNTLMAIRLEEDTAVEEIEATPVDAPIYNLQGVALGTDLESLPAGIYVRGGKKVVKR